MKSLSSTVLTTVIFWGSSSTTTADLHHHSLSATESVLTVGAIGIEVSDVNLRKPTNVHSQSRQWLGLTISSYGPLDGFTALISLLMQSTSPPNIFL